MTNEDRIIRRKLYHHEMELPLDMWDRIETALPPVKEERKYPFWMFMGLIALTLILITSLNYSSNLHFSHAQNTPVSNIPDFKNLQKANFSVPIIVDSSAISNKKEGQLSNSVRLESSKVNQEGYINPVIIQQAYLAKQSNEYKEASTKSKNAHNLIQPEPNLTAVLVENVEKSNAEINFESLSLIAFSLESPVLELKAPECPTFSKEKMGIYLDLYYSHDYGIRSFSPRSVEFDGYSKLRSDTETPLYSFSAGARISLISPSGIGLKTGFNYSQINERFSFIDPDAFITRTIIITDTIVQNGVTTVVMDTSTIRINGTQEVISYNKYRTLDIPLLIAYEGELTNRVHYSINGGVVLNILFNTKGRFINNSDDIAYFSSGRANSENIYKNSLGLSVYGSFGLHYRWSEKIDFLLEPNFRLFSGSFTRDDYELRQKYITGGLITGIRYKF